VRRARRLASNHLRPERRQQEAKIGSSTPEKAAPAIAGLVLAGGRSRRFGAEKAVALLQGRPLIAWALAALEGAGAAPAVSATPESGAAAFAAARGLAVLPDAPGLASGPLAGLAAGLDWAAARGCAILVTLPCDTPHVGAAPLKVLIERLGEADAAFACSPAGPHPLCAAWRAASVTPALREALAGGRHPAVRAFLAEIGALAVTFEADAPFANFNRPADLAEG
jgi:molybdenum cofactor guanylyltransferase